MSDAGPIAATTIVDFLQGVRDQAPPEAIHGAKRILLNGLRASLSGSVESLPARFAESEQQRLAGAHDRTGLLWSDARLPTEEAVAFNAMTWTLLLLDDLDLVSGIHPGGPAASAALPQAVARGASGHDLLAAIVAGIELQLAVARAASPEMLQQRGFAPLSVIAPLGSVAAMVSLVQPDAEVARNAVGIAAMSGIGVWEMGGTSSALFLSGSATRMGVAAMRAAALGISAPERALDGDFGAFRAYSGKPLDVLTAQLSTLGTSWQTTTVALQPYSGDTYSQAPLEAVLAIKKGLAAHQADRAVKSIVVEVEERVAVGVARKYARHPHVETALLLNSDPQSRVAIAWLHDDYSYSPAFAGFVNDASVAALRERVQFRASPRMTDMTVGAVDVEFEDGTHESAEIAGFRGSPRKPLPDDDLSALFEATAAPLLAPDRIRRILDMVWNIEDDGAVTALGDAVFAAPLRAHGPPNHKMRHAS